MVHRPSEKLVCWKAQKQHLRRRPRHRLDVGAQLHTPPHHVNFIPRYLPCPAGHHHPSDPSPPLRTHARLLPVPLRSHLDGVEGYRGPIPAWIYGVKVSCRNSCPCRVYRHRQRQYRKHLQMIWDCRRRNGLPMRSPRLRRPLSLRCGVKGWSWTWLVSNLAQPSPQAVGCLFGGIAPPQ